MADGYALALMAGLRAALTVDAGVSALVAARIYDEPPAEPVFPYLRFGEISPDAFDTDGATGAQVQIGLVAHSRSDSGRVEALRIVEAVKSALHRNEPAVTVAGFTLVELVFQTFSAGRDPEGRGYTATIALRAMLDG